MTINDKHSPWLTLEILRLGFGGNNLAATIVGFVVMGSGAGCTATSADGCGCGELTYNENKMI